MNNYKLLVCTSEYPPHHSSGIGNVAYNVVECLRKMNVDCTICSPNKDIKLGNSHLITKFGFIGLASYWLQVNKFLKNKSKEYDLVWLHNPLFIRRKSFQKSIITIHTTYYGKMILHMKPKLYNIIGFFIERFSLKQINDKTRFTAVSTQVFSELENIGIQKTKITYIPNGVNTKYFTSLKNKKRIKTKLKIPENNRILLSFGRLSEQKQPIKLLELFSIIENEVKDVTLVIAGRGELLEDCKEYAKQKQIRNVKFLGYVNEKNKLLLFSSSDYYILVSKYEGQPLTLLEAMSSGLPCIVSNIPNLRIVEDAACGLIVDINNIPKTSREIIEYLKKNHLTHSKNARKYTTKNLDWKIISEKYLDEFNKI